MSSIKKRPDGRYRARFRDPTGKERSQHFAKRSDAVVWLETVTTQVVTGTFVAPERSEMRLGEWGETWLAGRVDLKPKTALGYTNLWTTRIKPTWEAVSLAAVTNADIAAWVAKMHADGLSPSRIRQAFHLLSAMLADAVRDRRIAANPATGVRLPRMPRPEDHYLTHDELDALAKACGEYRTLVLLLGYCGLRWGEAVALRVGRVDVLRGRLDIAEAMTEVNGHTVFGVPKTHQRRSVPVPAFLRDDLARACDGKSRDAFVFPAKRGGVLRGGSFRRQVWNEACIKVGLGKIVDKKYRGATPHDLRHAAASFAIASGASVKGVQSMLGHASATQTLDRYAALWGDELDAVAERIDAARQNAEISRTTRGPNVVAIDSAKRAVASDLH
jgi:integrase